MQKKMREYKFKKNYPNPDSQVRVSGYDKPDPFDNEVIERADEF